MVNTVDNGGVRVSMVVVKDDGGVGDLGGMRVTSVSMCV